MNILGFVSMFLVLLAILTASFRGKVISSRQIQSSYVHYLGALRDVQNKFEKKQFTLKKQKDPPQRKPSDSPKKPSIPKKHENMPECARLNLWQLFTSKNTENKALFETLVRTLYQEKFFTQKGGTSLCDKLIDKAFETHKENPKKLLHLGKIDLNDLDFQSLYYHLLKGTATYDETLGTPPLLEYVKLEDTKDKICLACADKLMLSALFGAEIAQILYDEKEHEDDRLVLTKEKLEGILNRENISIDPNFWNHFYYKHPRKKKNRVTITGSKNDISVKQTVTLSHS